VKAAIRTRYGPPDVVEIRDVPDPVPVDDQVLVRGVAASVNRADLDLLYPIPGFTRLFLGLRRPRAPGIGCDLAGVVEAVGPGVTRFRPGDRVFGDMYPFGLGSFAERKVAPERAFLPMPEGMSFEVAATLPHAGILAIQGLRLRDGRTPGTGSRVLVVGASGNVGPFAVQVAKALGAEVTGICRADKMDLVRSLGADHVIDYAVAGDPLAGRRYDWILDVAGHRSVLAGRRNLRPNGVFVTLGGPTARLAEAVTVGPVTGLATGKSMGLMLWWKPFKAEDVATLTGLIADGKVRPVIDRRFGLDEIVDGLHYVDDGHARGKAIITF
jgi:NADPH:quinone reductase-like Zn-dependent oxidoreductase